MAQEAHCQAEETAGVVVQEPCIQHTRTIALARFTAGLDHDGLACWECSGKHGHNICGRRQWLAGSGCRPVLCKPPENLIPCKLCLEVILLFTVIVTINCYGQIYG